MNRSKSVILQRSLPFTSKEFRQLKTQVAHQINQKEKYRYRIQSEEKSKIAKYFTMAPSLLQSSLASPKSITKYSIRGEPSSKVSEFVEPCLKVRSPLLRNCPPVVPAESKVNNLNLMRFKRIIYGIDTHLCRTCKVDRAYKPKLFKRTD